MKFLNSHLLNNKSIIGQGFEKISVPMTTFKMKTIAAVLPQKGVGNVLCPKCNILNIKRYLRCADCNRCFSDPKIRGCVSSAHNIGEGFS
jgi:hypothetical protein